MTKQRCKMMEIKFDTMNSFLESICSAYGENLCLCDIDGISYTYETFFEKIIEFSKTYTSVNVKKGDRIAIVAANSSDWVVAYFAILRLGCVAVPILSDFNQEDIANILKEVSAKAVITCNQYKNKVLGISNDKISVIRLSRDGATVERFVEKSGSQTRLNNEIDISKEPVASIIYTSGTSGHSKGVVLTHANFLANLKSAETVIDIKSTWRFLSVLPLSHAYEFTIGMLLPLRFGACVYYLKNKPTPSILQKICNDIRPDVICMVPLLLEKIFKKRVRPILVDKFIVRILCKIPLIHSFIVKKIGSKIIDFFGGNIKVFAIGGAAIQRDAEIFLKTAELPYLVGYGLTEASPLVSGGPFCDSSLSLGSVGKVVPGVEVTLHNVDMSSGVGEIYVRGKNIMKGYFNNDQLTSETITEDGWLTTGDLGFFDKNKNLILTGRLKNTIVLSNGENIYPEEIEDKLLSFLEINEALVLEKKGRLEAIIVPNYEYIAERYHGKLDDLTAGETDFVKVKIDEIRHKVNKMLPPYSKIYSVHEQNEPLIKTVTHKIKRYLYKPIE